MKKFISLVAVATLLFSATSCREAEQVSEVSTKQNLTARSLNDSIKVNSNADIPNTSETKDPPKKDGYDW